MFGGNISKKNFQIFPPILGIGSAFAEALAICFTACVFFDFPISLGLICGFVVATVSPAVGMPTMLHLKEQGIGITKVSTKLDIIFYSRSTSYCLT